jgi:hypothetical protein
MATELIYVHALFSTREWNGINYLLIWFICLPSSQISNMPILLRTDSIKIKTTTGLLLPYEIPVSLMF